MKTLFCLVSLLVATSAYAEMDSRGRFMCQFRDVFRKGYNGYGWWKEDAYREARWRCERESFSPRTCSFNRCERR